MIDQLARAIEMVLLKQLKLITGGQPQCSGWQVIGPNPDKKMEMWIGIIDDTHEGKHFKITIEEIS